MNKKAIALISGGIDSPVATYLMMQKGVEVIALHMDNRPFTDDKYVEKAIALVRKLEQITGKKIKMYLAPHGISQLEFAKKCRTNLECVLCRRMMFRVARRVAEIEGAGAIITGESLGQVASQTLQNIRTEYQAAEGALILRPLIGLDKGEIIEIAKKIGTFDLSIQPGLCCTIVPEKPATRAKLGDVLEEEKKLEMDAMVEEVVKCLQVVN